MALPTLAAAAPYIPLAIEGVKQFGNYFGDIRAQQNQRNMLMQAQAPIHGQLGPEDELMARMQMIGRVAPQQRTQITQQPTMTPFQNLMSNAALVGAIPGMAQQIAPGLLPALSNVPGLGRVTDIFRPDTSYLDDAMAEATRNYQEQVVPGIMAMYGEGQDQARERALRQSGADFMRNQAQMRAGAYERGLGRMDASTQNLLNLGMQRRFENVERPIEQESQAQVQQKEFRDNISNLFTPQGVNRVSEAYNKANETQKMKMLRTFQKYKGRKDLPKALRKFNSPQEFEALYNVTESADPKIRKLADKIVEKGGTPQDIMMLNNAIQKQENRVVSKIAHKHGFKKTDYDSTNWTVAQTISDKVDKVGSFFGSIFGGSKKPRRQTQ